MEANNDLTDFQNKVFAEYELTKNIRKSTTKIRQESANSNRGCLSLLMVGFTKKFVHWILGRELRKRNFAEIEREARELLRQKEISDKICESIRNINKREILTEEKFVKELTATLYKSEIANRFVIPENDLLYAILAAEVFNTGLKNFCSDN